MNIEHTMLVFPALLDLLALDHLLECVILLSHLAFIVNFRLLSRSPIALSSFSPPFSPSISSRFLLKDISSGGAWVAQLAKHLPSAEVMILGP